MIVPHLTTKSFWENDVECYVLFMNEKLETTSDLTTLTTIEKNYYPHAEQILKKHKFEGKKGQHYDLTAIRNDKLIQFFFIGIGKENKKWDIELETFRRAIGKAVQLLKRHGVKSALLGLPDVTPYSVSKFELLKQIVITAHMAAYEFSLFKKESKERSEWTTDLYIVVAPEDQKELTPALEHGSIIGQAINKARNWSDTPPNILTPTALSLEAKKIADIYGLTCTIFGRTKAEELGMGSFLAVESCSDQDGKFVILEYKTTQKAPTIALVGKGITFDSGGISLKPSSGMTGMKYDMSGAAAVIATMEIISQLKPNVNVIGITPLTENMPSGKAARQDDIVVAMNGKSIEIKNTDAESKSIFYRNSDFHHH